MNIAIRKPRSPPGRFLKFPEVFHKRAKYIRQPLGGNLIDSLAEAPEPSNVTQGRSGRPLEGYLGAQARW